jgi:hypothetical protein
MMAEKWQLSGTYFEVCNCETSCPCVAFDEPTSGECNVLVGWHIDKGNFGDIELQGLNVAMAAYSPGNMQKVQWKRALYLDDKATPEQTEALTQIFGGKAGGHFQSLLGSVGELLGTSHVPMDYEKQGRRSRMRVGNIAEADVEPVPGTENVRGHRLCMTPDDPEGLSKFNTLTYDDYGYKWELSGTTGNHSPFTYHN